MAVEFIAIDRDTPYIFPPCVQDYLPEDHLARFVVDLLTQSFPTPICSEPSWIPSFGAIPFVLTHQIVTVLMVTDSLA
jgi:hypothetical protein